VLPLAWCRLILHRGILESARWRSYAVGSWPSRTLGRVPGSDLDRRCNIRGLRNVICPGSDRGVKHVRMLHQNSSTKLIELAHFRVSDGGAGNILIYWVQTKSMVEGQVA